MGSRRSPILTRPMVPCLQTDLRQTTPSVILCLRTACFCCPAVSQEFTRPYLAIRFACTPHLGTSLVESSTAIIAPSDLYVRGSTRLAPCAACCRPSLCAHRSLANSTRVPLEN
eukprot:6214208-Pleurochrysis_carterae.AAC.3